MRVNITGMIWLYMLEIVLSILFIGEMKIEYNES